MSLVKEYSLPSKRLWGTFTISTTATGQSGILNLGGATLAAIRMPDAWTPANLTFLAAPTTDIAFAPVYGSTGDEITYTVDATRIVTFDPAFWLGVQFLKVRSGTNLAPVAQAAERTLYLGLQALGVIR